jgi:DNA (cytosine-5)-methyltransferase 1
MPNRTFIDLFSGCGGFSLGLKWAGLEELAAIDNDRQAVKVFKDNFHGKVHVLKRNLMQYSPSELAKLIGTKHVDVIVGGPPCQGFSRIRQRDGSNSGKRIVPDERRELYRQFLKYVKFFKPKIFVMENVLGIRSAAGGHFFNRVQYDARKLGYRVHGEVIRAWEYGVPQKRQRQLIIGTQLDLPLFSSHIYMPPTHALQPAGKVQKVVTLWEAIGDLPPIAAGAGSDSQDYDRELWKKQIKKYTARYIEDVLGVSRSEKLTAHRARMHSDRDLRDFSLLSEGETSAQAMARGVCMEFPYSRENFKDRYTKQHRDRLCSTIVAHLSKDGLMFIHPTQNRSLTPREAARIQSFPDDFKFDVVRFHQFKLIGNAVPPLIGKAVGLGILRWWEDIEKHLAAESDSVRVMNRQQAIQSLVDLVSVGGNGRLSKLPKENFQRGWYGIAFLYNHLHPDSAAENGTAQSGVELVKMPFLSRKQGSLVRPIFERSGWPVILAPFAAEARRRFEKGEFSQDEYYCSEIFIAGYRSIKEK